MGIVMTPTEQQCSRKFLPTGKSGYIGTNSKKGGVMELVNLTPHEVMIVDDDGNVKVTITPSGVVARARQTDEIVGEVMVDGQAVTLVESVFGEVEDLPEPTEGVAYIVSFITVSAARAHGRPTGDLLTTSGPVRDAEGRIIGCRQLVSHSPYNVHIVQS